MTYERRSTLGTVVTWAIAIVLVVLAVKLIFWAFGVLMHVVSTTLGVLGFVLFTILPIVLVGWLLMKLFGYARRNGTESV